MTHLTDNWCTLPTSMGNFRMYDTENECVSVISMGDIHDQGSIPLFRVHSSCRASEVFGALDCDCADQLRETMKNIAIEGKGLIVYQLQEGRGHGLSLKIRAVRAMEKENLDTAQAFDSLGLHQDIRTYDCAIAILKQLNIHSVRLVSNNPRKHRYLNNAGIETHTVNTNPNVRPENEHYLHTKNQKLGHFLPLENQQKSNTPIYFYHSDQPWGELSNFSRHAVLIDGVIWPTTEHYYQAQKFSSCEYRETIRCCATPMLAKIRANELAAIHGQTDWIAKKELIMLNGLRAKFTQHPDLAKKLRDSGTRRLVELTNNDGYWGKSGDGSGQNRLGELLMQVRTEISKNVGVLETLKVG